MEDELISKETAKLAKKVGFNITTWFYYNENSEEQFSSSFGGGLPWNEMDGCYAAPSQALLQRWIRENFDIHLEITKDCQPGPYYGYFGRVRNAHILDNTAGFITSREVALTERFPTYEQALESALVHALYLLN